MQVKFEFGLGRMIFLTELSLLKKIQFPLSNFCLDVCKYYKVQIACVGSS
jgi:hypothetical protein